jgi:hypothetical protein
VNRLKCPAIHPVHPLPPFIAYVHESHPPQDSQVLRHLRRRLAEPRPPDCSPTSPTREDIQDLALPRLGHRVEGVFGGGGQGRAPSGPGDCLAKPFGENNLGELIRRTYQPVLQHPLRDRPQRRPFVPGGGHDRPGGQAGAGSDRGGPRAR